MDLKEADGYLADLAKADPRFLEALRTLFVAIGIDPPPYGDGPIPEQYRVPKDRVMVIATLFCAVAACVTFISIALAVGVAISCWAAH